MYLLAQFREERAYPLIMDIIHKANIAQIDSLFGDTLTEDLDNILASVYNGDMTPIYQLIENENYDEFVRAVGPGILNILVAHDKLSREQVINYYQDLFQNKLEKDLSYIWEYLVFCSCHLYPEELAEDIKQAFNQNLIDETGISWMEVQAYLDRDKDKVLEELKTSREYRLIENTVGELKNWSCFQED